jgi:hypothetical protein
MAQHESKTEATLRTWLMPAALAAAILLSASATAAHATGFRVYTCQTPDGRSIGPTIAGSGALPSGWTWSYSGGVISRLSDECAAAAPFQFVVESPMTAGTGTWARWTAAPGTELVGVTMRWIGDALSRADRGEGTVQLRVATDQETLTANNSPVEIALTGPGPNLQASVRPARWFELRFTCLDQCSSSGGGPYVRGWVQEAWFDVDDPSAPVGGLAGSATDAQTWSGKVPFRLNADDVGAGLARAVVESDGADALAIPLGDASCRDVGPDPSVAEYTAAQPCPLRVENAPLDIDSAKLPQGRHTVRVLLEDAAGNRTVIFGPVVRDINANGAVGPGSDPALRGAANGDGASDQARLTAHWGKRGSRTLLVSPFGRAHVVRGRLRAVDGSPIANATIDVISKTTAVNARELDKRNGPRTRSDGSWYLALPRRVSSRDVTFRYRSHVNDTIPSATARVRLRVRAGLRLSIRPRVARRGQLIRFTGRLLGGPLPRGGKQIVLMAHATRGAWVRFNVVRSGPSGRFRATYRFQQPGVARYRFRALSLAEAAYPYLAGGSNVVAVRKR